MLLAVKNYEAWPEKNCGHPKVHWNGTKDALFYETFLITLFSPLLSIFFFSSFTNYNYSFELWIDEARKKKTELRYISFFFRPFKWVRIPLKAVELRGKWLSFVWATSQLVRIKLISFKFLNEYEEIRFIW